METKIFADCRFLNEDGYERQLVARALGLPTGCTGEVPQKNNLMGFPTLPFRVCDFWAIHEETMKDRILIVRGTLPGGTVAVAKFRSQNKPRGAWTAHSLEEV